MDSTSTVEIPKRCVICGVLLIQRVKENTSSFARRQTCSNSCRSTLGNRTAGHALVQEGMTLGAYIDLIGSALKAYRNIRKQATISRNRTNPIRQCSAAIDNYRCEYIGAVETDHIRPISEFPLDTLIIVINSPLNLRDLCGIHHNEITRGFPLTRIALIKSAGELSIVTTESKSSGSSPACGSQLSEKPVFRLVEPSILDPDILYPP